VNSKKWLLLGLCLLALTGCQKEEVQKEEESLPVAEALTIEVQKDTYRFVDVEGNSYEADLLGNVPKNKYDYQRVVDENGMKYYVNDSGEKISKLGIDVSEYQPEVNWDKMKEAGVEFVIVRLGYRGYGEEGVLVEDPMFKKHVKSALKAGLDVGVYFFSQAISDEEVLEEAKFVLDRIEKYDIVGPVVFDTEEIKFDTSRTEGMSSEQFTNNCKVFCDTVEEAGYDSMIYANMKWLAFTLNMEELVDYKIWYADYETVPQNPYEISMWQYTETGKIDGIEGNIDLNVWFPENE